jgi:PAS domain S-box-containing protein
MDAAVPFALVAAVQLLSLAASLGLAAAAGAAAYRRGSRGLLVAGGLLLAAAHLLTGALLGDTGGGTAFAVVRAAGYLLVGLGSGGLAVAPVAALGVVVPLGAQPAAATVAAVSAVVATALSRRLHRPGAALLTVGLGLSAVTEMLATAARTSPGAAVTLLTLRGLAALAFLAFVVRLIESSLLAKVVAAILAAVLVLALGTAFIVGSVATGALTRDSERRLADVATGQVDIFGNDKQTSLSLARVLATCEPAQAKICAAQLGAANANAPVIGLVCGVKDPACLPGGASVPSLARDPVALASLRGSGAVREVLTSTDRAEVATLDVLLGKRPTLVALGVAPVFENRSGAPHRPDAAAVYAVRIDADRMRSIRDTTGFGATLYLSGHDVASSLPGKARTLLDRELARLRVEQTLRDDPSRDGVSLTAEGSRPGVRYQAIRAEDDSLVGVLALSADSNVILATERHVLSSLFVGTIAIALLVGLLAVALGRRIVRPVTELTVAASRVRRGDLDVRTDVRSGDELGLLSRTFDAMTASLASSNESLRRAAADEAALRTRLETIVDSIADGLVTTDGKDRVAGINGAALDLLGVAEDTLLGRPVAEVLAGTATSGEPLLGPLGEARLERTGRLVRPDGGTVPVALAATPLHTEQGHVIVVRDMRREHEIERMKTEFLSNVSHELRTPLTPIRGYAEILQRRPDLPAEKTTMYAGSILESSVRMSRVVDLLVDVASLEAGRVVPDRRAVPVGTFVDDRLAAWRKREPGREFRRRVAARLPDVLVDPAWVGKAYDELVDNAVKYSSGPVVLSASLSETAPDRVRLTVRDTGQGIPEDQRASLFTPFEQVDGSATRTVGGLGLGLSFVRRVADDFGLDVVVESTLGKGSAFSLEVPSAGAVRPAPRRRVATPRAPKRRPR